ncbi:aldo/keto reductase [Agrococcus sediminis]|uniref:aldo/keto reductase n=1 Tax=Agrococcus TaxID=46352 RepID=UPI000FE2D019|nr:MULTISPECIES: aldo/keto reductase [unclassified Agrococcus]MDR7232960.1 aryl-alcohol dehydrogenase-like predicted oxidoreductase [Agrococcus sp. BE272]RWR16279.1 aldo/keto reductase [Agrococcus lahaulensis]UOW00056.1 aldo/keto reductase [Agrococcus sp. SCSIO52902]
MTRTLGSSGIEVSTIGLGCNNFGRKGTRTEDQAGTDAVIHAAIDHGITLFDTADIYGNPATTSETLMGVALQKAGSAARDKVVLATKWGHSGLAIEGTETWGAKGARQYIRSAVEASLRRLQVEHIDLYQMHTPDPSTPIEQTVAALDELVAEGKIRAYGHSNFSAEQIAAAAAVESPNGFVSAQDEYSLVSRGVEREVLPAVREAGLGFLPYFPLANGLLTGKYSQGSGPDDARLTRLKPQVLEETDWSRMAEYERIVARTGSTMLEVTFQWLLAQPAVTSVIAGATRPEQIAQNAAAGRGELDAGTVEEISELFA